MFGDTDYDPSQAFSGAVPLEEQLKALGRAVRVLFYFLQTHANTHKQTCIYVHNHTNTHLYTCIYTHKHSFY